MTTPTPARDSRVEKLAACLQEWPKDGDTRGFVIFARAAGLVVLDPDDDATVERIARELHQHDNMALHSWDDCAQGIYRTHARWVLGALRGAR